MEISLIIALFISPFALYLLFVYIPGKRKKSKQLDYIENYCFDAAILEKLLDKYPHFTAAQVNLTFKGLRSYFIACHYAKSQPVGMPSKAVDEAWHQFILFTREYEEFCNKAYGRFLHHTPAKALKNPKAATQSIKRSWRLACYLEDLHPLRVTDVPLLFSIDDELNIPDGFLYRAGKSTINRRQTVYLVENIACASDCLGATGRAPGAPTSARFSFGFRSGLGGGCSGGTD